ncbi:MAG: tetratricopeptide repeat protein, partial [Candidatus Odinarchaeota archaeon]
MEFTEAYGRYRRGRGKVFNKISAFFSVILGIGAVVADVLVSEIQTPFNSPIRAFLTAFVFLALGLLVLVLAISFIMESVNHLYNCLQPPVWRKFKSIRDMTAADLRIHKYNKEYVERDADRQLLDCLKTNTAAILITGKTLTGKNRLVYECLKNDQLGDVIQNGFFLAPVELKGAPDRVRTVIDELLAFLKGYRRNEPLFILLEDLEGLTGSLDQWQLQELLRLTGAGYGMVPENRKVRITIIAWCRIAREYEAVEKFYGKTMTDFKKITVEDIPPEGARKICEAVYPGKDPREEMKRLGFNGVPGSLTIDKIQRRLRLESFFKDNEGMRPLYELLRRLISCVDLPAVDTSYTRELYQALTGHGEQAFKTGLKTLLKEEYVQEKITDVSRFLLAPHVSELELFDTARENGEKNCPWSDYSDLIAYIKGKKRNILQLKTWDILVLEQLSFQAFLRTRLDGTPDQGWFERAKDIYVTIIAFPASFSKDVASYQDHARTRTWNNLGLLYRKQGKEKEAEEAWLKAGIPGAWYNLGLLYKDQGKEKEAEEAWLKAGIPGAWYNLGVLYKDQGKEKEAEQAYLRAGIPEAWFNLGVLYKDQGKEKEAEQAYLRAGIP